MNDLIQALIKAGAPLLGTVIGGPVGTLAGAAIGALAEALGTAATPDAVKTAIETQPGAATIVRDVEAAKSPEYMAELSARLADVQDARATTVKLVEAGNWSGSMPAVLAIIVTLMFAVTLGILFFKVVPESQIAFMMIGAVISEFRGVLGYFFGTSAGSARNGEALRSIAQSASTPTAGQIAGKAIDAAVKTVSRK